MTLRIVHPETPATAEEVADHLRRLGFTPGAPDHITAEVLALDARAYRRCPDCGGRGRTFRAYHKGQTYVGLAACGDCGAAEVV
jgi:hypothetical protein